MKLRLRIGVPNISEEILKSINVDNKTAPKDFLINMKKDGDLMIIEIESSDIGSIISVLEEIFNLVSSLKKLEEDNL